MRYKILREEKAQETLEKLRNGEGIKDDAVEDRGEGEVFDERIIEEIKRKFNEIKQKYPSSLRARDPAGGDFEAEACVILHKLLPRDFTMLSDSGFWSWLAIICLREFVEWRHGGENKRAAIANFGIGNRSENLFYRMWLRADIGYDSTLEDPYMLVRQGDQDFWRSHILRQSYGKRRQFIRALIKYQFLTDSGKPRLTIEEIRELAKRLRRLQFNLLLEALNEQESLEMIDSEAQRIK